MSWIGEVGQWVGNDGSTLVAGLVGASAALAGGVIGRGRRERREDLAAWRDRRYDTYLAWLESASAVSQAALPMVLVCDGEPTPSVVDSARFVQLRAQTEAALDQMRSATVRIRFVTTDPLEHAAYLAWCLYVEAYEGMPKALPSTIVPDPVRHANFDKAFFATDDLRTQMQQELGLLVDQ